MKRDKLDMVRLVIANDNRIFLAVSVDDVWREIPDSGATLLSGPTEVTVIVNTTREGS